MKIVCLLNIYHCNNIFCAVQWFIVENLANPFELTDTDWIEEDVLIKNIVEVISIHKAYDLHILLTNLGKNKYN